MHRGRLDGLDGLRGIAALCVFLSHVFPGYPTSAYLAVDFFFMLSGYVMARSYEQRLAAGGGRAFMLARVRRLCPTILLSGLFALPWLLSQPDTSATFVLVCLALPLLINFPAWSIGAELFANLVHALGLARLGTPRLALLGTVSFAALVVTAWGHGLDFVPGRAVWWAIGLRALVPYIAGIVLHRLWRDQPPFAPSASLTFAAMPVALALATLFPATRGWADLAFMALICPLLIAGGLRRGQGSRLAQVAGAFSFPLYAAHAPAILTLQAFGLGWPWRLAAGLAAGALVMIVMERMHTHSTGAPVLKAA
ncbi:acyltransferase family protein [Novosphingobium resinovorum]|uniref:Acyltransferase 3 domain-containing protein n=1 Tax=Novosphingobium resinovorum TaxID=158500 RepID=A0A1D8A3Y2_9SPHN|nr:acyltransferase [Novosphingobium resinovorum]AOR76820.1 hypothetical protein BES08_08730 [Novosphingobium resinovorum]